MNVPQPEARLGQYPHEFSRGMRQRVLLSMALAGSPRLLRADKPTTASDVCRQAAPPALWVEDAHTVSRHLYSAS